MAHAFNDELEKIALRSGEKEPTKADLVSAGGGLAGNIGGGIVGYRHMKGLGGGWKGKVLGTVGGAALGGIAGRLSTAPVHATSWGKTPLLTPRKARKARQASASKREQADKKTKNWLDAGQPEDFDWSAK